MSGPAESSSEDSEGGAESRDASWRRSAAVLVGGAYAVALGWTAWNSSMDGGDEGTPIVAALLAIVGWIVFCVVSGYLLPRLVFVLIPLAVVVPAFIGERAEEFDNELRYFNWLLLIVLNAALVAPGAWLGRRRA